MRTLAAVVVMLSASLLLACGDGDSLDFQDPDPTPTALGASIGPGAGTPLPATPTQCAKQYTVASGDTLSGIATAHDVELQAVIDTNEITDPASLSIGQVITIPCVSASSVTPMSTAAATPTP